MPGSMVTRAFGINNSDMIVGDSVDSHDHVSGFLLSDGRYTKLDVPGPFATVAIGINDAGDIVGYYIDANFNRHGFLATPGAAPVPEASGLMLLGIGTMTFVGFALRRHSRRL